MTYVFDPGDKGPAFAATLRIEGHRAGVLGKPKASDSFVHEEALDRVLPGSGPITVTSKIYGLIPGEWSVKAELARHTPGSRTQYPFSGGRQKSEPLRSAKWSWRRRSVIPGPTTVVSRTRWWPWARLARLPASFQGSILPLVLTGTLIMLATQMAILSAHGVPTGPALVAFASAALAGLIGAKSWYILLHPKEALFPGGWAVDGFLVVAPIAAAAALSAQNADVGAFFDAATPGFFFTVALGRVGCFFTGCCAGRLTSSRWGVWSSDQRIAARRVPTQLLESGIGLTLAAVTLPLVVFNVVPLPGGVFGLGFAAYLVARQFLLRLRAEARRFSWERRVSAATVR